MPSASDTTASLLTPILTAEDLRFQVPPRPVFSIGESLVSLLSLGAIVGLSGALLWQLLHPSGEALWGIPAAAAEGAPAWAWLPFALSLVGAGLGFFFELYLLVTGTPFDHRRSAWTSAVQQLRDMNTGPLYLSIFFCVASLVVQEPALRLGLLFASGLGAVSLGFALLFGGAEKPVRTLLLALPPAQLVLLYLLGPYPDDIRLIRMDLGVVCATQMVVLLVGTATPLRSTFAQIFSVPTFLALHKALLRGLEAQQAYVSPGVTHAADNPYLIHPLTLGMAGTLALVLVSLSGLVLASKLWPRTYNNYRCWASNLFWSFTYFPAIANKRFPNPLSLNAVYKGNNPPVTQVAPYGINHPLLMPPGVHFPSASTVELSSTVWPDRYDQSTNYAKIMTVLGAIFPQADVSVSLQDKPRKAIWSSGVEEWPFIYSLNLFGWTVPDKILPPTPAAAIKAFREGQYLAYLCESGVANPFLQAAPEHGEGHMMVDFRYMEQYEVKHEYRPYGGAAYFRVNAAQRRLELVSILAPISHIELRPNIHDTAFRTAEAQILASLYFKMLPARHLSEIHFGYNMLEVAMHNAFDAQGQYTHPFRTFMYLHFFSHALTVENTTEQLMTKNGVFYIIWATTPGELVRYLNDSVRNFQIGNEEDFEERTRLMTIRGGEHDGELLPHCTMTWELRYMEIFRRYADSLIEAIYPDDAAVASDPCIQALLTEISALIVQPLPARHEGLRTRKGLARFALDVIYHLTVRHQIIGTTSERASMDSRLNKTQVPFDGGPPGVDEWRTQLAMGLATSRPRFTLLMGDFKYLIDGVDERVAPKMRQIFDGLQSDLQALELEWMATEHDLRFNYEYFRPLPSELRTGPGY